MLDELVLKIEDVHKSFPGTKALKGVSLNVRKGEIHALVGENGAGKSTLMNVISGVLQPDSGKIILNGEEVSFRGPSDAQRKGIGFVHQELALCPHVTVAQNIYMGRLPIKNGTINNKVLNSESKKILDRFDADFSTEDRLGNLSVAQQQVVEIARALSLNCNIVIFDEPTSSLNEAEAEALFNVIKDISNHGISVLYISHKLSEIFTLCDTVTVLRDGAEIFSSSLKDCTPESIVKAMVGRDIEHMYPPKSNIRSQDELFRVEGFSRYPDFINASFTLNKGEILGLSGLVGSGRTELSRAICGIDLSMQGAVYINGDKNEINNYQDAIEHGLCYLTEDRKLDGLFLNMSITNNIPACIIDNVANYGFIPHKTINILAKEYKKKLNIKVEDVEKKVSNLSGGNQQKVLISKLLATNPKIIIMDEPTRGIDVGAKSEIHEMLRNLCNEGVGIIVISSELPEIVGLCDRVIILHEGKVIGELDGDDVTQEKIIQKTTNFEQYHKEAI